MKVDIPLHVYGLVSLQAVNLSRIEHNWDLELNWVLCLESIVENGVELNRIVGGVVRPADIAVEQAHNGVGLEGAFVCHSGGVHVAAEPVDLIPGPDHRQVGAQVRYHPPQSVQKGGDLRGFQGQLQLLLPLCHVLYPIVCFVLALLLYLLYSFLIFNREIFLNGLVKINIGRQLALAFIRFQGHRVVQLVWLHVGFQIARDQGPALHFILLHVVVQLLLNRIVGVGVRIVLVLLVLD